MRSGGKLVSGWYCFGDYDLALIADVPDNQSVAANASAMAAGAVKAAKTTVLVSGAEVVAGMKIAEAVAKVYKSRPISSSLGCDIPGGGGALTPILGSQEAVPSS